MRDKNIVDLDELERKAHIGMSYDIRCLQYIPASAPPVVLALISRIRELESALSDALARVPADAERSRLVDVLASGAVIK